MLLDVYTLTCCRDLDLLYGSLLLFETARERRAARRRQVRQLAACKTGKRVRGVGGEGPRLPQHHKTVRRSRSSASRKFNHQPDP
jgi:hypothetical protein